MNGLALDVGTGRWLLGAAPNAKTEADRTALKWNDDYSRLVAANEPPDRTTAGRLDMQALRWRDFVPLSIGLGASAPLTSFGPMMRL
jgi:hypothetical protein